MFNGDFKKQEKYDSNDEDYRSDPKGKMSLPVTPKMLVKALKRLKKTTFKRLIFTPMEVTCEILSIYPAVEQDSNILLLEVSDKLSCAAAAGLLGTKQDVGYFAFDLGQGGNKGDASSELLFWIYYKKLLKKKQEKRCEREHLSRYQSMKKEKNKGRKTVRLMSFTDNHLQFMPLIQYRRKIMRNT